MNGLRKKKSGKLPRGGTIGGGKPVAVAGR